MPRFLVGPTPDARYVDIPETGLTIGRDKESGLALADDVRTSRRHARVVRTPEGWAIEDLGGANGTWVNGEQVTRQVLAEGDRVQIGDTVLVFAEDMPEAPKASPGVVPQAPAPSAQVVSRRRPGPSRRWLIAAAVLVALGGGALALGLGAVAIALPAASGRWDLLPSIVISLVRNGWSGRLNPAPVPDSGSAPLDLRPHPALHLTAPAGALDRPRQFSVRAMGKAQLGKLGMASGNTIYAPVAAFDVDAGMAEGELLPGEVRLAFSPAELGIPEKLWPHLCIAHVDPAGGLHPLRTRQEGKEVVTEIRHNSPFALALVAIVGLKALYVVDQWSKGALKNWHEDTVDSFRFFWPRSLPPRDTPEHRALNELLARKWEEYRQRDVLTDSDTPPWLARLRLYLQDPEVAAAYQRFHDPEWKKLHYYPPQVVHMVEAFQHAGKYLFDYRGFRRRSDLIEVYGLDPWTYSKADVYAYTKDGHFTYPYVHVNLEKVPKSFPASGADVADADGLSTTAVHELFHVVQKQYFNWTKYANPGQVWGGGTFVWLTEATALVLEEEAKPYYLSQGWNKADFPLTYDESKFIGLMKLPLDAAGADEEEAQHKGYAASRFLLELRDRYYAGNSNAFLPTVLESFCGFRMGSVDALVKATSQSETVLGADYLLYASRTSYPIYNNAPVPQDAVLGRDRPVVRWAYTGPLSSPCFTLKWRGLSPEDLKSAKVLVRTNHSIDDVVYNRWGWLRGAGTEWHTLTEPYLATAPSAAPVSQVSHAAIVIQRVESYASAPSWLGQVASAMSSKRHETTGLILLPPKAPPTLRVDEGLKTLRVEVPPSKLWKEGELKEYRVKIHDVAGGKPLVFGLGDKTEADIAWDQLLDAQGKGPGGALLPIVQAVGGLNIQDLKDMMAITEWLMQQAGQAMTLRVSYYEVAKGDLDDPEDKGIDGPESEIFKVPVDGLTLAGLNYSIDGEWTGQIMIAHVPASMTISGSGGTLAYGGDTYRIEIVWDAEQKAFKVTPWVKDGDKEYPSPLQLYLRRLPRERLWLAAPPIVFYRAAAKAEQGGGFFDWLLGRGK